MHKVTPLDIQPSATNILKPTELININHPIGDMKVCKICLEQQLTIMDIPINMIKNEQNEMKLIVPCQCSGSMGYVHHKCIRMWIQKQLLSMGKKEVYCQICKAQLYFNIRKQSFCQCAFHNVSLISGCNILSATVEIFLLTMSILFLQYSNKLTESKMLRYLLIVIIFILILALIITSLCIISQAFIKRKLEITRIFSIQQSEMLGLKEIKTINCNQPITNNHISQRQFQRTHCKNRISNCHLSINPPIASPHQLTEITLSRSLQII